MEEMTIDTIVADLCIRVSVMETLLIKSGAIAKEEYMEAVEKAATELAEKVKNILSENNELSNK